MTTEAKKTESKPRAAKRYWRVIKGNLYARLQYQDDSGKWKEKLKPITDKRTARTVVDEMRRELTDHGEETLQNDKMTFVELAAKYEQTKLVAAVYESGIKVSGKRSIAPVKSALKPLIEHFGRKTIRAIKSSDLEIYKAKRLAAPVVIEYKEITKKTDETTGEETTITTKKKRERMRKVATVNRELATMRAVLNFAIQNDWLIKNPFLKVSGIVSNSSETARDRVLSIAEEKRLLSQCEKQRAHILPLLICALDTGMRRGEMFKMRWRDVNLTSGEIFIPQTNTKTDAERVVGITPRLKVELEKLLANSPPDENGLVFGISNTIKTAWKTACDKADIKNFRLHDCRHTATTRMIASGSAHTEVMKITGHTQLKTFLRYLNITPETAGKVANNLDNYLRSVVTAAEGSPKSVEISSDAVN